MKKLLIALLLLAATVQAQTNPVTAAYPTAVVTDDQLTYQDDFGSTTLSSAVGAADLTIFITSAVGFVEPSVISICPIGECSAGNYANAELVAICGISGTTLTVCSNGRDLGNDGIGSATGAAFANGSQVELVASAYAHNRLAAEIKAIQTALGASLSNVTSASEFDTEAELEAILTDVTNMIVSTEIDTVAELEALAGAANLITSTEIDTIAELEALLGAVNVLLSTEIDTSAELAAILTNETGTGSAVFNIAPNLQGVIDGTGTPVDDDDCTGQQGDWWFDSTDGQFEFCNANSGAPSVPGSGGGGGGAPTDATYLTNSANATLTNEVVVNNEATLEAALGAIDLAKVGDNVATATALAANPADCAANQFAQTIAASGALGCAAIADADVPNTITVDLATLATTATTANAGDSATAFFSAGEIEDARLPSALTRDAEWDTEGEVQTAWGAVNILLETEIDAGSELAALLDDESGTGVPVFNVAPNLQGAINWTGTAVNDDDCTGQQGRGWWDSTDSQFEWCNANSGTPITLSSGAGDFVGPGSATDNAFVRFDTTTGKLGQNSAATLDDNGFPTWGIGYAGGWASVIGGAGKTSASSQYVYSGDVDAEPGYLGLQQGDAATKEEAYLYSCVDGVNGRVCVSAAAPSADSSDYLLTQMGNACIDSVGTDSYACSPSPSIGAYVDGHKYWGKAGTANTGTATWAFNGLSALSVLDQNGAALTDNCITAGEWIELTYNGTQLNLGYPCPGTASSGDSATAFFSSGTIEHERGGLEADVSAYAGLVAISGGATSAVSTSSGLAGQLSDESGTAGGFMRQTDADISAPNTIGDTIVINPADIGASDFGALINAAFASGGDNVMVDAATLFEGELVTDWETPIVFTGKGQTLKLGGATYAFCGTTGDAAIDMGMPSGWTVAPAIKWNTVQGQGGGRWPTIVGMEDACGTTADAVIRIRYTGHATVRDLAVYTYDNATYGVHQFSDVNTVLQNVIIWQDTTAAAAGTVAWLLEGSGYGQFSGVYPVYGEYAMVVRTETTTVPAPIATELGYTGSDGQSVYRNVFDKIDGGLAVNSAVLIACDGADKVIDYNSFHLTMLNGGTGLADDDDENGVWLECNAPSGAEFIGWNTFEIHTFNNHQHGLRMSGTVTQNDITLFTAGNGPDDTVNAPAYGLYLDTETTTPTRNRIRGAYYTDAGESVNRSIRVDSGGENNYIAGDVGSATSTQATDLQDLDNVFALTFATGQSFTIGGSTLFQVPAAAGSAPTVSGRIAYDSTANDLEYGDNGTNRKVVNTDEAQTLSSKTLTTPTIADFTNATHNHSNAAGGNTIGSSGITDGTIAAADVASPLKTGVKTFILRDPATADTGLYQVEFPEAVTLNQIECNVNAATSVTINLVERARATPDTGTTEMVTSDLVCDTNGANTTTFTDAVVAADVPLTLMVDAVSGTPTVARIHVHYTVN